MPLLSIITINRDDAHGLAVTADSIAVLKFRDFEWLVIDGNSSDHSVEIALAFHADRLISEADSGRYDAMNKGIQLATGRYVIFMNSGDAFHDPDCLNFLPTVPASAELLHGNAVFEENGQHFSFLSRIDNLWSFVRHNPFCHQALIYGRNELLAIACYDLVYAISADFDLTYRYVRAYGCCRRPEFIAVFRTGGYGRQNQLLSLRERLRALRRSGPWYIFAGALVSTPYVLAKFLLIALIEPLGGLAIYRTLRTRLHRLTGKNVPAALPGRQVRVLGVAISPTRVAETGVISFVNPFSIMQIARSELSDEDLERINFYSDGFALCRLAGWRTGSNIERFSFDFSSLAGEILADAERQRKRLAVVGANPESNQRFAEFLSETFPHIDCVYRRNGYFSSPQQQLSVAHDVAGTSPDIVLVGLGAGLQEQFALQIVASGAKAVIYTCGGFIDQTADSGHCYYPDWANRWNLRWLYRILREPRRLIRRSIPASSRST